MLENWVQQPSNHATILRVKNSDCFEVKLKKKWSKVLVTFPFLTPTTSQVYMISTDVLTRCHCFSLLFLLGLISDPDEHLKMETF